MGRIALRDVRAHLVRFLLSLLAVALGVAFVAGTFSLRTMMSGTFDGIVDAAAPADVYVRVAQPDETSVVTGPGTGAGDGVPRELVAEVADVDGVAHAVPGVSGPIVLVGADGTAVQSTQAPSFAVMFVPDDPSLEIVEGRGPDRPGEVALESATLDSSGLAVGDTTDAVIGGQLVQVEVVGRMNLGGPMAGATIVLVDEQTGLDVLAPDDGVGDIAVYAADGATVEQLVDRIRPLAPAGLEVVTGDALRADNKTEIAGQLGFITTFLLVFAAIALFVGAFIISNTFAMSVRQRMRELALLRAVGASPGQVFTSVLVQAAVVGLVGSALGIAGGLGLVSVLRVGLGAAGMDLVGDIPVDATTIVVSLLVGTLVSVLAAVLPARRAAVVPPVEAMRDDVTTPERSLRWRAVVGSAVTALGVAALVAALLRPTADSAEAALGAGAAAVLVGVIMLSPTVARTSVGVLAWPFVRLLRPIGRLARGNVVRNPRRTANTAGALMIGMALVGAVSVIAATAQESLAGVVEAQTNADLVVQSASNTVPTGAVDDVVALPEAGRADPIAVAPLDVTGGDARSEALSVIGAPDGTLGGSVDVDVVDGTVEPLGAGQVAVQEPAADEYGWQVGDTLTVTGDDGPQELTVVGVFATDVLGAPLAVDQGVLDVLVPPDRQTVNTILVSAADGVSTTQLQDAVTQTVAPYVVVSVLTRDEYVSSLADQVNQVLVILYALLGLSVVIAVLGIINTLALSVIERTREIGLLRAVGLGRLQLAGTVTIESVLTALFGTVLGLGVGVALAATLPTVFADQGLSTLVVPWGSLGAMLVLALVVGILAALWPAVRAARMRVLDAVAYE